MLSLSQDKNSFTKAYLWEIRNRKKLLHLAHQTCSQTLQCRIELCAVLNREDFLQRKRENVSIWHHQDFQRRFFNLLQCTLSGSSSIVHFVRTHKLWVMSCETSSTAHTLKKRFLSVGFFSRFWTSTMKLVWDFSTSASFCHKTYTVTGAKLTNEVSASQSAQLYFSKSFPLLPLWLRRPSVYLWGFEWLWNLVGPLCEANPKWSTGGKKSTVNIDTPLLTSKENLVGVDYS